MKKSFLKPWRVIMKDDHYLPAFMVTRKGAYLDEIIVEGVSTIQAARALRRTYRNYGDHSTIFSIMALSRTKIFLKRMKGQKHD